jgi:hypothetical protein
LVDPACSEFSYFTYINGSGWVHGKVPFFPHELSSCFIYS